MCRRIVLSTSCLDSAGIDALLLLLLLTYVLLPYSGTLIVILQGYNDAQSRSPYLHFKSPVRTAVFIEPSLRPMSK